MELIERADSLTLLREKFDSVTNSEGHCILLAGEAGIGKTSLINVFCASKKEVCKVYLGTCDDYLTPKPLAPFYDIAWQMQLGLLDNGIGLEDKSALFNQFLHQVTEGPEPSIVIFEDVHWADEATLDFIMFFARRVTLTHCLFILTFRDDEINSSHPLRSVLGQMPPDAFTRLKLLSLSRNAVEKLAIEKGYDGVDVYGISGGNPFYVNEILASYSSGVPENIKDAVLSVYNRQPEDTKKAWQLLSVMPGGFEFKYIKRFNHFSLESIKKSFESKILILNNGLISFKHELYRRTIETSLRPSVSIALNKCILDMFLGDFELNDEIERIIHHAKNANQGDLVVRYAPVAARRAACLGSHSEASRLYFSAISFYTGLDKRKLAELYQVYAYECYLISLFYEAIIYQRKALDIWQEKKDIEQIGNAIRFLSRLCWYNGNRKKADVYADQAIEVLGQMPASKPKGMAFSNMSQLKMLSDEADQAILWGNKAILIATEISDDEILCHALNNIGSAKMLNQSTWHEGVTLLNQSLAIALKYSYHEHAVRAYVNLVQNAVNVRDYTLAIQSLEAGIEYCRHRDLDSWVPYLISYKSRVMLNTGQWDEAGRIAKDLLTNSERVRIARIIALTVTAIIKFRKGADDALPYLAEAKCIALETTEVQRILPVFIAILEYEWITGMPCVKDDEIDEVVTLAKGRNQSSQINEFAFWLYKVRNRKIPSSGPDSAHLCNHTYAPDAANMWEGLNCPYEQALALFNGSDVEKKKSIKILQKIGATAVFEKLKLEMRTSGIKNIPRGIRMSTRSNVAYLTGREMDILHLLKVGMQNKEIAEKLFISAKTVDHHISSILSKLNSTSRTKAVMQAINLQIITM